MQVKYRVHRANVGQSEIEVVLPDGSKTMATVNSVEVELVPIAQAHGTISLRFTGSHLEESTALYRAGQIITAEFTVDEEIEEEGGEE